MPLPLPAWLAWVAVLTALYMTRTYWVHPLAMRFSDTPMSLEGTTYAVVEDVRTLDPALQMPLNRQTMALEALGFVSTPAVADASGKVKGVVRMFEHPGTRDVAELFVLPNPAAEHGAMTTLVFVARLADGRSVYTASSPIGGLFPTDEKRFVGARFPGEDRAERLHALHRAHVARTGLQVALRVGDPAAYQQRDEVRSHRSYVDRGYMRSQGKTLGFTWKGAVVASWRMQWPFRERIAARDEKLRQELLEAAGLAA